MRTNLRTGEQTPRHLASQSRRAASVLGVRGRGFEQQLGHTLSEYGGNHEIYPPRIQRIPPPVLRHCHRGRDPGLLQVCSVGGSDAAHEPPEIPARLHPYELAYFAAERRK